MISDVTIVPFIVGDILQLPMFMVKVTIIVNICIPFIAFFSIHDNISMSSTQLVFLNFGDKLL